MKRKKGQARKLIFWGLVIFGISCCFFWARDAAFLERGYQAVGGEWLLWLLPGLLWVGIDTAREIRRELKKGAAPDGEEL